MITVASMLWDANAKSHELSRCFDETWVTKLYNQFKRNLTVPFEFKLFTERPRRLPIDIEQIPIKTLTPHWGCYIEPFALNEPMILVGLDTLIVGNIDHMAQWCLAGTGEIALPRNPYKLEQSINAVALVQSNCNYISEQWRDENDMEWLRKFPCQYIDDLWPKQVLSYKAHRQWPAPSPGCKIVYFHGKPKMDELKTNAWIMKAWQ